MIVLFHKHFDKKYTKAPQPIQSKALAVIQLFKADPFNSILNNHALTGRRLGSRSIDVTGNWRIIYLPVDNVTALFTDLGTHTQLYG